MRFKNHSHGKKVKWGVIGSGGIARRRTIPEGIAQAKNAELISVYDINPEVNNAVAKEFQATAAQSIRTLVESDIDAVYIASPANMHLDHVLACAAGKKHILCEKPLGLTVGEAEQMIKACNQNGVILGTALMMRFLSQHKAALKLISEGKLGKPVFGRAQLSCWYPPVEGAWRQDPATGGGGSLMDMGSHCIDLLEMFFGPVKSVSVLSIIMYILINQRIAHWFRSSLKMELLVLWIHTFVFLTTAVKMSLSFMVQKGAFWQKGLSGRVLQVRCWLFSKMRLQVIMRNKAGISAEALK